jgi:hypothetical protein
LFQSETPVGQTVRQMSFVRQIVVAERAVDEAYGRTDDAVPVAIKLFAVTEPAIIADDEAKI